MCRRIVLLALACLVAACSQAGAVDIMLYDAATGQLPESQPWLFYAQDAGTGGTISKSIVSGGTSLATNNAGRAGWSNTIPILNILKNASFPALNPGVGFALEWSMQVLSEGHASNDRAGTSVILLGSDNKGVELGFWADQVWAQSASPSFTHGESVLYDTSSSAVRYRLEVQGPAYLLYANGSQILSGATRSYAAFGSAPYTLSNYLFLGDNTTSAGATTQFGSMRLVTPVPEPSTIILAALGIAVLGMSRKVRTVGQRTFNRRETATSFSWADRCRLFGGCPGPAYFAANRRARHPCSRGPGCDIFQMPGW